MEWNWGEMDERRREEGGERICWWGYDVGWGTIEWLGKLNDLAYSVQVTFNRRKIIVVYFREYLLRELSYRLNLYCSLL